MQSQSLGVTERSGGIRNRLRLGPGLAVAAVIAALGSRFFLIIWKYSINVFFYDQWSYLTPFFRHQPSLAELFFWQHGEHFEGVGLIAGLPLCANHGRICYVRTEFADFLGSHFEIWNRGPVRSVDL